MNRRTSLKYLTACGALTALGGGVYWLARDRQHAHLSIDAVLNRLNSMDLEKIETSGTWDIAKTFNHLAQSVEFSIAGYPEMKPKIFQNTVGKLAFSVFQANGHMTHALDDEIPGAVSKSNNNNSAQALNRLIDSLEQFDGFAEPLKPHFAYGELNKTQYALAHVMHVNNHLEEFRNT